MNLRKISGGLALQCALLGSLTFGEVADNLYYCGTDWMSEGGAWYRIDPKGSEACANTGPMRKGFCDSHLPGDLSLAEVRYGNLKVSSQSIDFEEFVILSAAEPQIIRVYSIPAAPSPAIYAVLRAEFLGSRVVQRLLPQNPFREIRTGEAYCIVGERGNIE